MGDIFVPGKEGVSELMEKRSRFLGRVAPVGSEEEARAYIEAVKKRHRDARHNCWCYRLQGGVERYSDDGEPQGTAGTPMLALFQKAGVQNGVCVVTRYFGGVLLGAGGLVRAYTQCAQLALEDAGKAVIRPFAALTLPCPYPMLENVKALAARFDGQIEDAQYGALATLRLSFPEDRADAFLAALTEMSAGGLSAEGRETVFRTVPWAE